MTSDVSVSALGSLYAGTKLYEFVRAYDSIVNSSLTPNQIVIV